MSLRVCKIYEELTTRLLSSATLICDCSRVCSTVYWTKCGTGQCRLLRFPPPFISKIANASLHLLSWIRYRKLSPLIADLIVCDSWASASLCICVVVVVVSPEHHLLSSAIANGKWRQTVANQLASGLVPVFSELFSFSRDMIYLDCFDCKVVVHLCKSI